VTEDVEKERQRDRKTERQKDRETERKRDSNNDAPLSLSPSLRLAPPVS
jgi:hypothetical protein